MNLNDVKSVPVFSTKGNSVKVEQVIDNFALGYDYNVVRRFNRERCMMMQCDLNVEPIRWLRLTGAHCRTRAGCGCPKGIK